MCRHEYMHITVQEWWRLDTSTLVYVCTYRYQYSYMNAFMKLACTFNSWWIVHSLHIHQVLMIEYTPAAGETHKVVSTSQRQRIKQFEKRLGMEAIAIQAVAQPFTKLYSSMWHPQCFFSEKRNVKNGNGLAAPSNGWDSWAPTNQSKWYPPNSVTNILTRLVVGWEVGWLILCPQCLS